MSCEVYFNNSVNAIFGDIIVIDDEPYIMSHHGIQVAKDTSIFTPNISCIISNITMHIADPYSYYEDIMDDEEPIIDYIELTPSHETFILRYCIPNYYLCRYFIDINSLYCINRDTHEIIRYKLDNSYLMC